ncbi:uncharacterized protein [Amphiura filiformis]|uniref:uncharacterized protein n=1 Tax=Amphiura filiformis TaxID=82378 RepID=UPI003B222317
MEGGYKQVNRHGSLSRRSGAVLCVSLGILLLVGIASVMSLILNIFMFMDDCDPMLDGVTRAYSTNGCNTDEVWIIHMAVDDGNLEYIDNVSGTIKGYNIDVVNAVCRRANKNCQIVLDSYSRCWSGGYGGEGLMSRWYHACTGWRISRDRQLTFKFTDPFQQKLATVFVVKPGDDKNFNWRDLTGKKIGFWEGWFSDPNCLNRRPDIQGLPLHENQMVMYQTSAALEMALGLGEIDAAFVGTDVDLVARNAIISDEIMTCSVEGAGMMMRKDTYLENWWNPAWRVLLASDEYQQICDDIERVHGHKPGLSKKELCRDKTKDLPKLM